VRYGHVAGRSRVDRPDYNTLKAMWTTTVAAYARKAGLPAAARHWRFPIVLGFWWFEPDRHRDPDGVSGGGRKLILDGLVGAGVLPTDSSKHIERFRGDEFRYGMGEGVSVGFFEVETFRAALLIPAKLPDLNELLAARELGARRMVRS